MILRKNLLRLRIHLLRHNVIHVHNVINVIISNVLSKLYGIKSTQRVKLDNILLANKKKKTYTEFHYIILRFLNLRKVTIYLLTSCNTEERIAQNIYIHNSNRNYKKLTTTTILIKKRIGIGYRNYESNAQDSSFA